MGRFFLIILGLQCADKVCTLLQETYVTDLALPYFEISSGALAPSMETKLCQAMGFTQTFCDYMSQFYALWFAVVMKQVVKDPISKHQKQICFFHMATLAISGTLTAVLSFFNTFGVQEDLQCGIMFTPGLDDEILMIVPFVLVFIQMYCIRCITNETPFIVKESVRLKS